MAVTALHSENIMCMVWHARLDGDSETSHAAADSGENLGVDADVQECVDDHVRDQGR
jgi:hypothetical protein